MFYFLLGISESWTLLGHDFGVCHHFYCVCIIVSHGSKYIVNPLTSNCVYIHSSDQHICSPILTQIVSHPCLWCVFSSSMLFLSPPCVHIPLFFHLVNIMTILGMIINNQHTDIYCRFFLFQDHENIFFISYLTLCHKSVIHLFQVW